MTAEDKLTKIREVLEDAEYGNYYQTRLVLEKIEDVIYDDTRAANDHPKGSRLSPTTRNYYVEDREK